MYTVMESRRLGSEDTGDAWEIWKMHTKFLLEITKGKYQLVLGVNGKEDIIPLKPSGNDMYHML
jgi:hypothetical protein